MAAKKCTKCKKVKLLRYFSIRKSKKKDGSPMYLSQCKACVAERQRNSVRSRKEQEERGTCDKCGEKCHYKATRCSECKKDIRNQPVDPKWLVRGKQHNYGGSPITNEGN